MITAMVEAPLRVVFVAGAGRSGSTLLDRLLGSVAGACSVGELRQIWWLGLDENEFCGCGSPFQDCPFWGDVMREAFGGFGGVDGEAAWAGQSSLLKARNAVYLTSRRLPGGGGIREEQARWTERALRLYRAIATVSGGAAIIDSSKNPMYGLLLAGLPDVDLRVIHLVRDSRAVAYSWAQRLKPHPLKGGEPVFKLTSHTRSAVWWDVANAYTELAIPLRRRPFIRIRYEDLARVPARVVERLARFADLPAVAPQSGDATTFDLQAHHTIGGNPMRFEQGAIKVRSDEEWRTALGPGPRRLVTALTLPLLAKYGYLRRQG